MLTNHYLMEMVFCKNWDSICNHLSAMANYDYKTDSQVK